MKTEFTFTRIFIKKTFAVAFSFFLSISAFGQLSGDGTYSSPWSGTVSVNTFWDGTVYVSGDIAVDAGTLTIAPGATIIFLSESADLRITGTGGLWAEGTFGGAILFTSDDDNDGIYGESGERWGHISFESSTGTSVIKHCTVEYGYKSGPGIEGYGGGIHVNTDAVTITDCVIRDNYALWGGGLFVNQNRSPEISGCYVRDNVSLHGGGGFYFWNGSGSSVTNCVFHGNQSQEPSTTYYTGGGLAAQTNCSINVVNCTFVDNTSYRAEGQSLLLHSSPDSRVVNSVFWGSPANQIYCYGTTGAVIINSAYRGITYTTGSSPVNSIVLDASNEAVDGPNFVSYDGSDWSLKYVSPCRDAGVNSYSGVTVPSNDYNGVPIKGTKDIGAYEVAYEVNGTTAVVPRYNGDISAARWTTASVSSLDPQINDTKGYNYYYDGVDRLVRARYINLTDTSYNGSYDEDNISYDLNGNITGLARTGSDSVFATGHDDILSYAYINGGNRLGSVSDAGESGLGFVDGNTAGLDYLYDGNGNLIEDKNKGLEIEYNLLNLPRKISDGGDSVVYVYDASGTKLRKKVYMDGNLTSTTDYCGGTEFLDDTLKYLYTDEGVVEYQSGDYVYEYFLRDHLGNTRAVVSDDGNGNVVIGQVKSYYPFGMSYPGGEFGSDNNYLYNGKELQDESLGGVSLGLYDYGARFYDPVIARWTTVDPFAEKYTEWSPYNYVTNNPLLFLDTDGRDKLQFALNFKMNSGKIGTKVKVMGVPFGYSRAFGGVEQKFSVYVEYDTDTRKMSLGVSHTQSKSIDETSVEIGAFHGTDTKQIETVMDINTVDGATKTEDKKTKTSSEGGIWFFSVEEEDGNTIFKSDFGTGGEVNLGIFGVGAELETNYTVTDKSFNDNNKSNLEKEDDKK